MNTNSPQIIYNEKIKDYLCMLNDKWRNQFFYSALHDKAKDKVVLDMGSGTGLLSFYALKAGAKFVYCIESDPTSAFITKQVLKANFDNKRFKIINCDFWSTDLTKTITHPIDILVSETVGPGLFDQGMLKTWQSVRPYLAADAISIPDRLHIDVFIYEDRISSLNFYNHHDCLYPLEMIELDYAKSLLEVDKNISRSKKLKTNWIEANKIQEQPKIKEFDVISIAMKDKCFSSQIDVNNNVELQEQTSFELDIKSSSTVAIINKISFEKKTLYLKDAFFCPWKFSPVFFIENPGVYKFHYTNFNGGFMKSDIEWSCVLKV